MRHIKSDVVTVGFGGCMGMSGFLLAVGKKVQYPQLLASACPSKSMRHFVAA